MEVGKYALAHSTKDALAKFSKQYHKYTFKHTSISSWKASFKNNGNSQNLKKIGRPNLSSEELLKRTKYVITGSRLENTVISRRMVISIGAANNPGTRYTSLQNNRGGGGGSLLFLNTYMGLTIILIIGTSVLFLELLKFLQIYKSCFSNYNLLQIKRL